MCINIVRKQDIEKGVNITRHQKGENNSKKIMEIAKIQST